MRRSEVRSEERGSNMRRTCVVAALAVVTTAAWAAAAPASAGPEGHSVVRWDIINLTKGGVLLAGGAATSTSSATGDTLTLTGTGQAEPAEEEAAGGGTFVHRDKNGAVHARGVYTVKHFVSFKRASGSLVGSGVVDAIGELGESHSGVLTVRVAFRVGGKVAARGTLVVTCALPGAPAGLEEGVTATARPVGSSVVLRFNEKEPDNGPTNFHIIR